LDRTHENVAIDMSIILKNYLVAFSNVALAPTLPETLHCFSRWTMDFTLFKWHLSCLQEVYFESCRNEVAIYVRFVFIQITISSYYIFTW